MNQLGLAMIQYTQDYDDTYPLGGAPKTVFAGNGWGGQIYPYVKSKAVYTCPDDKSSPSLGPGGEWQTYDWAEIPYTTVTVTYPTVPLIEVSYAYNLNFALGSTVSAYTFNGLTLGKVASPAATVMFFEVTGPAGGPGPAADITDSVDPELGSAAGNGSGVGRNDLLGVVHAADNLFNTGYFSGTNAAKSYFYSAQGVHSGGANYTFADGHSKWMMGSMVSAGNTNTTGAGCGVYPNGDYDASGAVAASGNAIGTCGGGGPEATFSTN